MKYKLRPNNYDFKLNINKKCANYLVICTFFIYKEDLQLGTKLEEIIRIKVWNKYIKNDQYIYMH